jgi:hypothetical protein
MIPIRTEPKSDQFNADDLAGGQSLIVTVAAVRPGPDAKQAIDIVLAGHDRVYRPCLTMRRVLMACWGGVTDGQLDPAAWVGKRIEIYTDPTVRFGSEVTGGLRIRGLSGIPKPYTAALTVTKGKRATWTINVLPPESKPQQPSSTKPTDLPKFVAAVPGIAPGLTVPLLREYMTATAQIDIDTLSASELSAVVGDIKQPAEVERLTAWLVARGGAT